MTDPSTLTIFAVAGGSLLLMLLLVKRNPNRAEERLAALSSGHLSAGDPFSSGSHLSSGGQGGSHGTTFGRAAPKTIPTSLAESQIAKRLKKDEKKKKLQARILQAGLYRRNAAATYVVLRLVLLVVPITVGFFAGRAGVISPQIGMLIGLLGGLFGTLAPSFWLDHMKRSRQKRIRRALPDALDVISVCLQAGQSLSAALSRVARELATAHPQLALELSIVERETRLGRTTGEAMRAFADRFDLEELRSLASVVKQAETFGSSVTQALEVYSETLRLKRHQRAEELANKAVIKMIFPTLLCIFPAIFVVVLGPAAIRIAETLKNLNLEGLK